MEKFIINEKAIISKNILITDDDIKTTDENYKTKALFLEKLNNGKKKLLDTQHQIKYSEILKFIPTEDEYAIQLFFNTNKKSEKTYLEFNSFEEYSEIKDFIISKTQFTKQQETKSSIVTWIKQALYTLITAIVFIISYNMANNIESGESITINGGKRGLKKVMFLIAETLGSTGVIIIGVIVVAGMSYWTYKASKKGKALIEIYQ